MKGNRIILAAHRGDRAGCPENTMPAFVSSEKLGVDMIETDLHMTKDGVLVIMHDRSALRTCGVDKLVDEMTYDEIKQLDAGKTFGKGFEGTPVPTVEEFIIWVKETNLLVNWEIKDYPGEVGDEHAFECADKLVELIEKHGMGDRSMLNSFSARVLEHIKKNCGNRYPLHGQGIDRAPKSKDVPEIPVEELFDWCCLYAEEKGHNPVEYAAGFEYCEKHGILSCVCIPEVEETYRRAIELGCKMFTVNNIIPATKILKDLGVR